MSGQQDSTPKLILFAVIGGIVLLIAAALLFRKEEVVTLPVSFEEFTDFQCPACAAYHPVVKKILSEYSTDNVSYSFRNFPLESIHPQAYGAALAAQAAKKQGQFDAFADIIFSKQDNLSREELISYAGQLGMDIPQFTADMDSSEIKGVVDADILEANTRNVNATPTFFINGKRVVFKQSDNPELVLRETLNSYIEKATKSE